MSQTYSLKAESRQRTGSGVLKQMRREGWLPSVVYGDQKENQNVKVNTKALSDMLQNAPSSNIIVDLEVDGKVVKSFIQGIQREPLSGDMIHVDFLALDETREIRATLPVILEGEPEGVKLGGLLQQLKYDVKVACLPKHLPEGIPINVEHLSVGQVVKVKEVTFPEGVRSTLNADVVLALVAKTRAAQSADASGGEGESAEGAA